MGLVCLSHVIRCEHSVRDDTSVAVDPYERGTPSTGEPGVCRSLGDRDADRQFGAGYTG